MLRVKQKRKEKKYKRTEKRKQIRKKNEYDMLSKLRNKREGFCFTTNHYSFLFLV